MFVQFRTSLVGLFVALTLVCIPRRTEADTYTSTLIPKMEPRISIVIDDLGNNMKGTETMLGLQIPLTVAIMPQMSTSRADAVRAKQCGDEVLVHLPMEPKRGKRSWLGPGAITTMMSDEQIKETVRKDLDSVPFAVGVNNHMGSKATSSRRVMRDVLEVVAERHMFVVDSNTSPKSVIPDLAKQLGIPYTERTVFLDDVNNVAFVKKQITKLIRGAKMTGWGLAIGHVGLQGPNTARAIQSMIPVFRREGISVVPASYLVYKH